MTGVAASVGAASERLLTVAPSPAMWAAVALYALAAGAFLFVASRRASQPPRPGRGRVARVLLILGVIAHGVDIGWRGTQGVHPAETVREALGFLAWILAGGYLGAAIRWRLDLAGAAVAPAVLAILLAARLSPAGGDPEGLNTLGRIHITLATVGVAAFAVATALAVIYLLEDRNLRRKKFEALTFKSGGAPLERLDILAHRIVLGAFPVFSLAVVLGAIWLSERGTEWDRPEYPLALITWFAFAVLLMTRTLFGWRGRRSAKMTIVGFAAALLVLAIYLVRRGWGG